MMQSLKEVIISITNRCNLRCRMCDIPYEKKEELSTEQWKKVISGASRLGAQTIVFSGGEPLLRADICELVAFSKKNNMSACITSNGCLLDGPAAVNLSSCGVSVVNISIEGTRRTHDYLRGAGAFDRAVSALGNLKKNRIEATVASTVTRYNYKDMPYILDLAKEHGATTVRFQPFNNIFLGDRSREGKFLINNKDVSKVERVIEKVIALSKFYNIATNPEGYLNRIPAYLSGNKFLPNSCAGLQYLCPINSSGEIFPCWIEKCSNNLIGNVKDESLYDLWLSQKRADIIKFITARGCSGCMMSCYDEVFGKNQLKDYMLKKVKRAGRYFNYRKIISRIIQRAKRENTKLILRYRFYRSYRGSLFGVFKKRFKGLIRRYLKKQSRVREGDILPEIAQAKQKLKKEISSL